MGESKLFSFRQIAFTLIFFVGLVSTTNAQLIDEVIGQKRSRVQALLKPYRILDYKKEREVHNIEAGIHQTVLFENDTCKRFYWAVTPTSMSRFKKLLVDNGYQHTETGFAKDSLQLLSRELNSGKAILFIASISLEELTGPRDMAGRKVDKKKTNRVPSEAEIQAMPRLQQAILEEEVQAKNDTMAKKKKPKEPQRHWVGPSYGRTSVLGWE